MTTKEVRIRYERLSGRKGQLEASLQKDQKEQEEVIEKIKRISDALSIVRAVAQATQQEVQYQFSEVASLALNTVFDEPYKLVVDFVQRRNKTEADIFFERDGEKADPMTAAGGGAVDVAALALRITLWAISHNKTVPVMVLDEPLRFLSRDMQNRASTFIKEISKKLGLQFIIVTHIPELAEQADRVFTVSKQNGLSKVDSLHKAVVQETTELEKLKRRRRV